jgi:hypothetical protein
VHSGSDDLVPVDRPQNAELRLAALHCLFQHRIENRLKVAGRRIDDAQHFRRRGLLVERLARLGQQPRVLHCDDRLRREVL